MIPLLLIRCLAGAVVDHVATQCQCQGRLLGEAKRDLEVLKKAHYKADRDMENLEERFERELQAANYEIRKLKVRIFALPYSTRNCRWVCQTPPRRMAFVHDHGVTLVFILLPFNQAVVARERRAVCQQTPADTGQHAIVRKGSKTM